MCLPLTKAILRVGVRKSEGRSPTAPGATVGLVGSEPLHATTTNRLTAAYSQRRRQRDHSHTGRGRAARGRDDVGKPKVLRTLASSRDILEMLMGSSRMGIATRCVCGVFPVVDALIGREPR